ncbi:MAG: metallophosphoesterase [Bryobacterales bacterium]|nr:metallophosphoesterase [Bryobacterales bacterium]
MRIFLFSDVHNDKKTLENVLVQDAEYVVCAGDLVSWGRGLDACGEILQPLGERLLVLPGNHESIADIDTFCERFGFQPVHGKQLKIGGFAFAFLGYSNPTPFDTPGEYSEAEFARHLNAFREAPPEVLVCHCPPYGTGLDQMRAGGHAGSTAIREFIDAVQPRWFFSGHIHETEGVQTQIGFTTGRNPGRRGFLLEL